MIIKTGFKNNWQAIILVLVIIGLLFSLRTDKQVAQLGHQNFRLEKANTPEQKAIGLSGRESLGKNEGMIFANEAPDEMCMWMKDMRFSLAIIWIDEGKIAYIEPDLSPSSYPQTYCHRGSHVIEVNVADLDSSGLKVGQEVELDR